MIPIDADIPGQRVPQLCPFFEILIYPFILYLCDKVVIVGILSPISDSEYTQSNQ